MGKRDDIIAGVHPQFKRILMSVKELNGETLEEFTRKVASDEEFEKFLRGRKSEKQKQMPFRL